jgi:phospholipid transport system substrate-binding protein
MKCLKSLIIAGVALVVAVMPVVLQAEEQPAVVEMTAHQTVEDTTKRVLALIDEARGYIDEDPERFYQQVDLILEDIVDFNSFARGVMGKYASKKSYMALASAEEKQQFRDRVYRFSEVFKNGLVQTYAKGLLTFNGQRIEVVPPAEGQDINGASVTVVQHIYGDAEKPYVIHYKLRRDKAKQWKLRNVTIEAINLGKVYQSQFYSAVKQQEGDIDKVIEDWSVDPTAQSDNEAEEDA